MDSKEALEQWPRAEIDVNPLAVAEDHWFHMPECNVGRERGGVGYREQAIHDVARRKVPFSSTVNSIFILAQQAINHLLCPYCRGELRNVRGEGEIPLPIMENTGHGSGNGSTFSIGFRCVKCGATAAITLTADGLSFRPKEDFPS